VKYSGISVWVLISAAGKTEKEQASRDPEMLDSSNILSLCAGIDEKAGKIYLQYAREFTSEPELVSFWRRLAAEESEHKGYWEELGKISDPAFMAELFADAPEIQHELEEIDHHTSSVLEAASAEKDLYKMLLQAYEIEFYLLHPVFIKLLYYLSMSPGRFSGADPLERYREHISGLNGKAEQFGQMTRELKLLGKALDRMFTESRSLVETSFRDELSGLYNRRGIIVSMRTLAALSQRKKLSVAAMMIDIDDFKKINDAGGHMKGDRVIREAGRVIAENIRSSDIAGRYGGDEFLVFLSAVDPDFLYSLAEKIRMKLYDAGRSLGGFTVSIGVHHCLPSRDLDKSLKDLLARADDYLYEAKSFGKNRVSMDFLA
jgi:diguanylate cyclase (GGDEF)-like protein